MSSRKSGDGGERQEKKSLSQMSHINPAKDDNSVTQRGKIEKKKKQSLKTVCCFQGNGGEEAQNNNEGEGRNTKKRLETSKRNDFFLT